MSGPDDLVELAVVDLTPPGRVRRPSTSGQLLGRVLRGVVGTIRFGGIRTSSGADRAGAGPRRGRQSEPPPPSPEPAEEPAEESLDDRDDGREKRGRE